MSAAPASKATYTADDLLAMEDGEAYELDDGELVERHANYESSTINAQVGAALGSHVLANRLGRVSDGSLGLRLFPDTRPRRVPRADVVFFSNERRRDIPEGAGFVDVAPDLAVEVVSPGDDARYLQRKVNEYLAAGVRTVWVVFPNEKQIFVHTAQAVERYGADDTITGGDILPGFAAKVADLLALD